jgi:hypothetical protein
MASTSFSAENSYQKGTAPSNFPVMNILSRDEQHSNVWNELPTRLSKIPLSTNLALNKMLRIEFHSSNNYQYFSCQ